MARQVNFLTNVVCIGASPALLYDSMPRAVLAPAASKNSGSHFLLEFWTAELNPGSKKYTV
eukprot:COSAG01_NODE_3595_length_5895_cov_74.356046_6_plen_61_part_00